jgi:hypothetical protein
MASLDSIRISPSSMLSFVPAVTRAALRSFHSMGLAASSGLNRETVRLIIQRRDRFRERSVRLEPLGLCKGRGRVARVIVVLTSNPIRACSLQP